VDRANDGARYCEELALEPRGARELQAEALVLDALTLDIIRAMNHGHAWKLLLHVISKFQQQEGACLVTFTIVA